MAPFGESAEVEEEEPNQSASKTEGILVFLCLILLLRGNMVRNKDFGWC